MQIAGTPVLEWTLAQIAETTTRRDRLASMLAARPLGDDSAAANLLRRKIAEASDDIAGLHKLRIGLDKREYAEHLADA